jgi:Tol biopolymer transport system component
MSRLDDRLTTELERAARPADPAGIFNQIDHRRARRHIARRIRVGALAIVVIAGSIGGFAYLNRAFGTSRTPGGDGSTPVRDGLIVVSAFDQFGIAHLWVNDPTTGERRPLTAASPTDTTITSDGSPAVSPDGLTVAFARSDSRHHASAIYTIGIDGEGLTKIADAGVDPTWSPDGSRLAFTRDLLGTRGIWTMNADGSDPTLVAGTDTLNTGDPAWSPDGTTLAFEAFRQEDGGDTWDIFTIPLDATGPLDMLQLTDSPDHNETSPSWSPDGTRIVYTHVSSHPNVDKSGGIAVITLRTGDVVLLTAGGPYDQNPSWSPSGSSIAFDRSNKEPAVYTMGVDGSDLTEIAEGVDPAWQPVRTEVEPTPTTSPSPASDAQVDLGLGFPVCDVRSLSADMDGDGSADTVSVATKVSDAGGCPARGTSTEVLTVDLNGDGKADAIGGPLACPTGCEPFATPDVDGDGLAEIAIVVDRPADGTKRIQLWDVTTPPGGELAVIPFVDENGDPATFTWGTVSVWGGSGPEVFGLSCTSRTSPPLVTEWQAIPTISPPGPESWHISEHGYQVVGSELRSAFEDSYDFPGEETVFPDGGGDMMCGTPVQAPL